MAEDTETTTEETTDSKRSAERVPLSRFNAVTEKLAEERKRAAELEERLEALEQRDKTDVERLTRDLEKAQKKFAEAEQRAAELESARQRDSKSRMIAMAAAKAKFHDPDLVAQIVNLDDIEDAKSADDAVKAIAKDRPYLVQQEDQTRQRLRRVGVDGGTIDDEAKEKGLVTVEEQERAWGEQMLAGLQGQLRDQQV